MKLVFLPEFVVVKRTRLVLVNSVPVFGGKVVKEGLGRVRHTSPCGGLGTTLSQFTAGYFGITVGIAKVPQWIPV